MTKKERQDQAAGILEKVRSRIKAEEDEVVRRTSFRCAEHGRARTQSQCVECWEAKSYAERFGYQENRQHCIAANKKQKRGSMKNAIAKTRELKVGQSVEVILDKSHPPVRVQITKEMKADREAALNYAADAARTRVEASLKLAVAVALYAGDSGKSTDELLKKSKFVHTCAKNATNDASARSDKNGKPFCQPHLPWAIDGFDTFEDAMQNVFGMRGRTAYYQRSIGMTLLSQYGRENVLAKAQELGVSQIHYSKLREFLRFPKQLEQLLTSGRIGLPDGSEVTVAEIAETPVRQLSLLFERLSQPASQAALPDKKKGEIDPVKRMKHRKPHTSAAEAEERVSITLNKLKIDFESILSTLITEVDQWPENALKVIEGSPKLHATFEECEQFLARMMSAFFAMQRDPGKVRKAATVETPGFLILKQAMEEAQG